MLKEKLSDYSDFNLTWKSNNHKIIYIQEMLENNTCTLYNIHI